MKTLLKILLPLVLFLVLAEVGLRLVEAYTPSYYIGNETGKGHKAKVINMYLQEQINKLWTRTPEQRKTILEPPFPVFVNKNFENQKRLDYIFERAALPKNMNVTAENFLRLNKSKNNYTYTATTNSLSFRGPERSVKKPKNTFRIILLGSYPAFGHGVNDDETYAHYIEQNFKTAGKNVEVWNGGRQGGTSIMGYTRLIKEVEQYSPDLVIWDYGWIELYLGRDRVPNPTFSAIKMFSPFERKVLDVCLKTFLSSLRLCTVSVKKITKISYSDAIYGWQESMDLVKAWAKDKNVPVIFLRHRGVTIPAKEYEAFHSPENNFTYVDTSPSILEPPRPQEVEEFWSQENWLTEVGFTREAVMAEEPIMVFFGDGIQYNKLGYKRIGNYLTEVLKARFPQLSDKKKVKIGR